MSGHISLEESQKEWHGTFRSYMIGFFSSLFLTCASFSLVVSRAFSNEVTIFGIVGLALLQAIYQLLFFLHLREEAFPRWGLHTFYFMLTCVLILVLGTLWIMFDLNERVMSDMMKVMND